jgi:fructose 1,6-bisphosphatase
MSKHNNKIINSTNKMKTTLSIIKSETNRLKGHSNYENSPNTFNDYFLSEAEKSCKVVDTVIQKTQVITKIQSTTCL